MGFNTAVVGASKNPERYAYKAMHMLKDTGHKVAGIHPSLTEIEDFKVFPTLSAAKKAFNSDLHTVTLYVGPSISDRISTELISAAPTRVIMNPGAENPELQQKLEEAGIEVVNGCTLVMLRTGQY